MHHVARNWNEASKTGKCNYQERIQQLEFDGLLTLLIDDETITIKDTEVEIISEDIPGWQVTNEGELTVALDVSISGTLQDEGNARELVNKIQKMRKEIDLNVVDRINVSIEKHDLINSSVINFKSYICAEILADQLELVDSLKDAMVIDVNDFPVNVIISPKNLL